MVGSRPRVLALMSPVTAGFGESFSSRPLVASPIAAAAIRAWAIFCKPTTTAARFISPGSLLPQNPYRDRSAANERTKHDADLVATEGGASASMLKPGVNCTGYR
jgi:hypothetical protein